MVKLRSLCVLLLTVCMLNGCTSNSRIAYRMFHDALVKAPDVSLNASQIKKLPYAASYVRLGDDPRAMVILARVDRDERIWVSHDHEYLITRHGRIVRTDGLQKANLKRIHFDHGDPLSLGVKELTKKNSRATGYVDLMPDYQYGLPFVADYHLAGKSSVEIDHQSKILTQVDEVFKIPLIHFTTVNHYWMDSHGFIWKSVQRPIPSLPSMTLITIKPYLKDVH